MATAARAAKVLLAGAIALAPALARSEVIEEIVANVNDDVISKSDLQQADQELLSQLYKSYSGKELDERVKAAEAGLLIGLIDRKVLLHRASRLYDMQKMGDGLVSSFREDQKIKSDEELKKLLDQDGMTLDDLKQKLIEWYAPDQVLNFEVRDRVSVGDKEVERYYQAHPEASEIPAVATLREIVLLGEGEKKEPRRAEAEAVRERAAAPGADFAAIAREVSESGTKSSGGLLSDVKHGELADWLDKVAFSLPIGQVSPVIDTPLGFFVVKVESRTEAGKKSLDEIREALRDKIYKEKFQKAYDEFIKKARGEADIWVSPKYMNRIPPGALDH